MTTWTESTPLNPTAYVARDYVVDGYINDWTGSDLVDQSYVADDYMVDDFLHDWIDPAESATVWTAA